MATYATQADFEAYVEGWETDNPAALERWLLRAERDINDLLGAYAPYDNGLKFDPVTDLEPWERDQLARAVSAQAYWLISGGGAVVPTDTQTLKRVKGPDFEKEYFEASQLAAQLGRRYGPRVRAELSPIAHLRIASARATA
jgi:hypothetical protein